MPLRLRLAILLYPVAFALPAGAGAALLLSIPGLSHHAGWLLPYLGAESLVIGAALAWHLAAVLLAGSARTAPVPVRVRAGRPAVAAARVTLPRGRR